MYVFFLQLWCAAGVNLSGGKPHDTGSGVCINNSGAEGEVSSPRKGSQSSLDAQEQEQKVKGITSKIYVYSLKSITIKNFLKRYQTHSSWTQSLIRFLHIDYILIRFTDLGLSLRVLCVCIFYSNLILFSFGKYFFNIVPQYVQQLWRETLRN